MQADAPAWSDFVQGWELFRDPILCAAAAGAVLGFLGVYIVLRRMVFVSAGVTQAAGLGVAFSFYAEIHLGIHLEPLVGAAVLALSSTLLLSTDGRRLPLPRESLLGLVFALSGGAAILVGERVFQEAHDIESILFGSAVLVRPLDFTIVLLCGGAVLLVHTIWLRGIAFAAVDPDAARVQGVPVRVLGAALFVSIGLMVGVSSRALGALPVFAFSVMPAAAALALGLRLPWAFAAAAVLGALSGVLGYLVAFFFQFPVGGSQTVVASALLVAALALRAAGKLVMRLRKTVVRNEDQALSPP
jgi:zinc transport system permease protein